MINKSNFVKWYLQSVNKWCSAKDYLERTINSADLQDWFFHKLLMKDCGICQITKVKTAEYNKENGIKSTKEILPNCSLCPLCPKFCYHNNFSYSEKETPLFWRMEDASDNQLFSKAKSFCLKATDKMIAKLKSEKFQEKLGVLHPKYGMKFVFHTPYTRECLDELCEKNKLVMTDCLKDDEQLTLAERDIDGEDDGDPIFIFDLRADGFLYLNWIELEQ